ncbi:MAG: hypothetical protein OXI11_04220 [Gammaproteobacteria bacterium]|nr:hypothetical protein [Gammaproteobacteria bacterium]MXW45025.1 hypothetical protein [Gammaproteobacteria bacterium]MYD01669.1 hypothetical protein [Gammaproteobacteria bacterium]
MPIAHGDYAATPVEDSDFSFVYRCPQFEMRAVAAAQEIKGKMQVSPALRTPKPRTGPICSNEAKPCGLMIEDCGHQKDKDFTSAPVTSAWRMTSVMCPKDRKNDVGWGSNAAY